MTDPGKMILSIGKRWLIRIGTFALAVILSMPSYAKAYQFSNTLYTQNSTGMYNGQPLEYQLSMPPASVVSVQSATGPLVVSTKNPRYFTDGSGRAVYLTGSHTWANFQDIGNIDPPPLFGYTAYLDFLRAKGHNFFRLWSWEQAKGAPWTQTVWFSPPVYKRTGPGYALDGQPKFNLDQFNQEYFDRLRSRVIEAGERGIYVSIMLFNGFSVGKKLSADPGNPWPGHPFNKSNNINGINGDPNNDGNGYETQNLSIPAVTALQEAYVRKIIDTVNDLDNVLYEICNECNQDSTAWQYHMIDFIHKYEATKPKQHPVGMTVEYPNGSNAELFNSPADWISPNDVGGYKDNPPAANGSKVILVDTDHLWGEGGDRQWVWKSFTRGLNPIYMDCYSSTYCEKYPVNDPTRLSVVANMGYVRNYANFMNLLAMIPRTSTSTCSTGYCLVADGLEYLVYRPASSGSVTVNLSAASGQMAYEWFNPATGTIAIKGTVQGGSSRSLSPPFSGDAILYVYKAWYKGWNGGVSIDSNRNVVAVGRPHVGSEVMTYDGFSSGNTTAYVPMLFKDAFGGSYDSALYVENLDTNNTADITIHFYDSSGNETYSMPDTIAPLASKGYWLPSIAGLGSSWVGGVKVESNRNIVAVGRPHVGAQVMTYNGFSAGSTTAYVPMLFKDAFGGSYDSALYIQNVDASNIASITIRFYDANGVQIHSMTDALSPLASKGYWLPSISTLGSSWVGGVKVESDQDIVAVGRPHIGSQITTYDGFSSGSSNAYVPMLFKDAYGGSYDSALYVQNVDASNDAHITIRFYDSNGVQTHSMTDTLSPLASKGYWLPSISALGSSWIGGVKVESDRNIVAVGRPHVGVEVTTYNGFASGSTNAYVPMMFKDAFGGSYDSALYIQNLDTSNTANVTIKFYDTDGNLSCTLNDTISALASKGWWLPGLTCSP